MKTILKHRRSAGTAKLRSLLSKIRFNLFCLTGFIVIGVLWQITVRIRGSPALPPLPNIFRTLLSLAGDKVFLQHIFASITTINMRYSHAHNGRKKHGK